MPNIRFALAATLWVVAALPARSQPTALPDRHAIENVRLSPTEGAPARTLLIRHGRIERILEAQDPIPSGTRIIDGKGGLACPAFLDAYTRTGLETAKPVADQDRQVDVTGDVAVDMRDANRKGIQPAFRAADAINVTKEAGEAWRKDGFGAALIAPGGELLAGSSVLITTREAAARDRIVRPVVFDHAAFAASGAGYPSTLMGYFAQLRQFFLDARRHQELLRRYAAGASDPRPPFDRELAAAAPLLLRERRVVCEAEDARDIERFVKLAEELGIDIAIAGGREAWKHAGLLRERGVPVVLTLEWGEEVKDPRIADKDKDKDKQSDAEPAGAAPETPADPPRRGRRRPQADDVGSAWQQGAPGSDGEDGQDPPTSPEPPAAADAAKPAEQKPVWEYAEPTAVQLDRRLRWEEGRDCALRLQEAGVEFAFGSGRGKPADLVKHVRTLVKQGLPSAAALAALGPVAAKLLGVERRLGRIAEGHDATFAVWTADPTGDDAQLAWLIVDGWPHEFEIKDKPKSAATQDAAGGEAGTADPSGVWTFTYRREGEDEDSEAVATLALEDGKVSGTFAVDNPMTGSRLEVPATGELSGNRLSLSAHLDFGGFEVDVEVTGDIDGDAFRGDIVIRGEFGERTTSATGTRAPLSRSADAENAR